MEDTDGECYVCYDSAPPLLERICECKSIKIHQECIDRMLAFRVQAGSAIGGCPICGSEYTIPPLLSCVGTPEQTSAFEDYEVPSPTSTSSTLSRPASPTPTPTSPVMVRVPSQRERPSSPVVLRTPRPTTPNVHNNCTELLVVPGGILLANSIKDILTHPPHNTTMTVVVMFFGCVMFAFGMYACALRATQRSTDNRDASSLVLQQV